MSLSCLHAQKQKKSWQNKEGPRFELHQYLDLLSSIPHMTVLLENSLPLDVPICLCPCCIPVSVVRIPPCLCSPYQTFIVNVLKQTDFGSTTKLHLLSTGNIPVLRNPGVPSKQSSSKASRRISSSLLYA